MNWKEVEVYAVKHKDGIVRENSRSGGIFTALSDEVLNKNGVIYGCILTENFEAIHIRAESIEDRNYMRGSKYIQSSMNDIFQSVLRDLKSERIVLFSGTSCQIAGLKAFLKIDYHNLLCVDIVCHGVPSPLVWQEYIKWQETKHGKIVSVDFRNKKDFGWASHIETLITEQGKKINSNVFTTLFYGHAVLRPCCYKCPYKDIIHPGDITIADYWGIDKAAPGFNDNKGVSLVLINNDKGKDYFNKVQNKVEFRKTDIRDSMQPPLEHPFDEPKNRTQFWIDFYEKSFSKIANEYGEQGWKWRVKRILSRVKSKIKRIGKVFIEKLRR